jgi:hypothetical protein
MLLLKGDDSPEFEVKAFKGRLKKKLKLYPKTPPKPGQ